MECVCKWCVLQDCEWNVFVSSVFYETVSGMCL